MTKFILHGGGETENYEKHNGFFREIMKNLPDNGKILVVYFAIPEDGIAERHPVYEKYFSENSGGKKFELKIATEENFIEELRWADAVYFRGGNTYMLLDQVTQYPNFKEELLKKKLVAGSSAGVYFLSDFSLSARRNIIYKGLGILPIKNNCHYTDDKEEAVKVLDKYPGELVLLREGEFKVMEI